MRTPSTTPVPGRPRAPAMGERSAAGDCLAIEAAGARLLLRCADSGVQALARECLPPGAVIRRLPHRANRPHTVYRIERMDGTTRDRDGLRITIRDRADVGAVTRLHLSGDAELAAWLQGDLEFRVALHATQRVFVHAATVAWRGRVLALPGRSHAGKSTLAAALVQAGAHYFSDEFAVIDADGLVHPFPRPLQLRAADGSAAYRIDPAALGAVGAVPAPLGLVGHVCYRPGRPWSPRRLGRGETVLALFENAVAARVRPAHTLAAMVRAVRRGGAEGIRAARGEAEAAAAWLLRRLDESDGPDPGDHLARAPWAR